MIDATRVRVAAIPRGNGGRDPGGYTAPVRRNGHNRDGLIAPGERVRRALERWLNHALTLPDGCFPRIPLRRVSEGGFESLRTRRGRRIAERWWGKALENENLDIDIATPAPRRARRIARPTDN